MLKIEKNLEKICLILELIFQNQKFLNNFKKAKSNLKKIGLPAIIRPSFTLGGLGGGIARTKKDFLK